MVHSDKDSGDSGIHSPDNLSSSPRKSSPSNSSRITGSPKDLSQLLLQELACMNVGELKYSGSAVLRRVHHPGNRKLDRDENRAIFWKVVADHPSIFANKFAVAFAWRSSALYTISLGIP
ncbi:unnamed protein product [Haemonchus placei]|uniref:Rab-GAP TBC domain-containing protein n=1 Tax=Haemonchus placei TaxID=6290 RepID=A0A0N4WEG3_HAEPC|nr:unnamed protein product [Haemonchus placei]